MSQIGGFGQTGPVEGAGGVHNQGVDATMGNTRLPVRLSASGTSQLKEPTLAGQPKEFDSTFTAVTQAAALANALSGNT